MGRENIVKPTASNLEGTICILSFLPFIYYETLVLPDRSATFAKNRKGDVKKKRLWRREDSFLNLNI